VRPNICYDAARAWGTMSIMNGATENGMAGLRSFVAAHTQ